jgi:hypothetical protein
MRVGDGNVRLASGELTLTNNSPLLKLGDTDYTFATIKRDSDTQVQAARVTTESNLQFSVGLLRYPTFCAGLSASHKSLVRTTNQLTRS